ncbi:hypothetical protein LEAN103870_04970 [Legionella anisa]|uniref:Uncharacterized protein n=1 Tax=Legionella anisa TaxID=28082 RepID=A0AAX0WT45_9GAMM|nr:hypothetical protein [Legionella anisa]AWN73126.1 hypothetical protein DLD14_04330 [Legionella anisa]KTC67439.1 hypothetical protein Lani_3784 [Legionella anisa]MCW8423956.1 hypothetical protein [Legionella anisa]MCW8447478.1 hypothetical protein [Legionella anisa]PNL60244.1 hypothetical protein A6J39_002920 [Legionella anisa]
MQSKKNAYKKKKRRMAGGVSNPQVEERVDFTHVFEQFMRTDLERQNLNKPASAAYDRIKQEITDAEEKLNKIKTKKGKTKKKAILNETITKKKKWLSDINDTESKNFLAFWATMFHGYRVDLVVNQKEHIRRQGLTVKAASEEFVKLLLTVLSQDIKVEGKTYTASELKKYKRILNRFCESIKTIVIEDKNEITSKRIKKLLSGNDLTIEHSCIGHAIYTQIYQEKNQLVITHCNRGNGQRSTYNLVYRINIAGLDLGKLRVAIETIAELEVVNGNEEDYKKFYDQYDKTLKDLGFSFSLGKHVKSQKIGNCVLANLKGLLKERLPDEVYKWCTTEMKSQSIIQHLINPMLQSGKDLKNKQFNIDTDDDFFHLRQLINYIFDKSVEGVINCYFGNIRKSESLKKAFKAIGVYEHIINENKALSRETKADIKNYIHSRIDIYKKISSNIEMRKPEIFYQVLWNEAEKIVALSSEEPSKKEFFKHLISKAAHNPNFFSDVYEYFNRENKENSNALLKLVFTQAIEIITDDSSILNDPENIAVYRCSLRRILLNECEKVPCDQELITLVTNTHLNNIDPTLYVAASVAMNDRKNDDNKYATLKLLLDSTLKNSEFLDLFVRKKKPPVSTFFKQKTQPQGSFELSAFFKAAAEFIIDNVERPLTQEKLQLHIGIIFQNTMERTADINKVKRFLELFCYKELLDSKKINEKNISYWKNLHVLANQCKQINYCFPDALKISDSVLDGYHKLKTLTTKLAKQDGKAPEQVPSVVRSCFLPISTR